jgi:drug/metabolite transporter (DMT)-like permease
VIAVALALGSSVAWGTSDFLAGTRARRMTVPTVLVLSQATSAGIVLVLAAVTAAPPPAVGHLLFAALAGLTDGLMLFCLYRAMAVGNIGVVAPLAGGGAIVPLAATVALGQGLTVLQLTGVAVAVCGTAIAARETTRGPAATALIAGAGLALAASLFDGVSILAMDAAADGGPTWTVLVDRLAALALLAGAAAYGRSAVRATGRDAGAVVAIGTLDAIAQLLFAVALTHGEVGVVAALGTLYPVTTVLLAGMLLRERPDRIQRVGVGACLAGVVMLSA